MDLIAISKLLDDKLKPIIEDLREIKAMIPDIKASLESSMELLRRQDLLAESMEKIGKLETKINGQDLQIALDRANRGRRGEDREEI